MAIRFNELSKVYGYIKEECASIEADFRNPEALSLDSTIRAHLVADRFDYLRKSWKKAEKAVREYRDADVAEQNKITAEQMSRGATVTMDVQRTREAIIDGWLKVGIQLIALRSGLDPSISVNIPL